MADSSVPITAGVGTNIDTRTEATNGDHRQVVTIGDPSVTAGVAGVVNATPGASDYGVEVWVVGKPTVQGDIAHGVTNSGNPLQNGYEAIAHGTNPTAVTAGQRTKSYANRAGVPFVMGGHPNVQTIELAFTAAQTDIAIVTIGSGLKIVCTQVQVVCDNANTVNMSARVGFGLVNTPTTTGVLLTHPGIAPGSGNSRGDGSGILGVGADNEDLRITASVPTGGSGRVLVSYYTIES